MQMKDFQALIKDLYYEKDRKRGAERTFLWLVEEVGELARATRNKDRGAIKEEMADVIAWTVSLANIYGVDIENELERKYPGRCSYCGNKPCTCI